MRKQTDSPITVGRTNAAAVHFHEPVSFLIVRHVVAQGKCISENSMVHTAVSHVQPLLTSSVCSSQTESISVSVPVAM